MAFTVTTRTTKDKKRTRQAKTTTKVNRNVGPSKSAGRSVQSGSMREASSGTAKVHDNRGELPGQKKRGSVDLDDESSVRDVGTTDDDESSEGEVKVDSGNSDSDARSKRQKSNEDHQKTRMADLDTVRQMVERPGNNDRADEQGRLRELMEARGLTLESLTELINNASGSGAAVATRNTPMSEVVGHRLSFTPAVSGTGTSGLRMLEGSRTGMALAGM